MHVTGWRTGTGFGIRLNYRDKYFKRVWKSVKIQLDSGVTFEANLSKSFWGSCPEIRNKLIGKWMIEERIAPWPENNPPNLKLELIGARLFRLILFS